MVDRCNERFWCCFAATNSFFPPCCPLPAAFRLPARNTRWKLFEIGPLKGIWAGMKRMALPSFPCGRLRSRTLNYKPIKNDRVPCRQLNPNAPTRDGKTSPAGVRPDDAGAVRRSISSLILRRPQIRVRHFTPNKAAQVSQAAGGGAGTAAAAKSETGSETGHQQRPRIRRSGPGQRGSNRAIDTDLYHIVFIE